MEPVPRNEGSEVKGKAVRDTALRLSAYLLITVLLVSITFMAVIEDAFISLRYALFFSQGQGLVFNPGDYIEGYSNLLWVLLAGAIIKLGIDPILSVKALSFISVFGCFFSADRLHCVALGNNLASRIFLQAALFTFVPFSAWSFFGMETPLFALLLSETAVAVLKGSRTNLLIALVLLSITRPEGMFMGFAVIFYDLAALNRNSRGTAVIFVLWIVSLVTWRYWYYGMWMPNSVLAKSRPLMLSFDVGFGYVRDFLFKYNGAIPVAMLAASAWRANRREMVVPYMAFGYIVFIVFSGGDYLMFHRFFAHIGVLLIFGATIFVARIRTRSLAVSLSAALLFSNLAYYVPKMAFFPQGAYWVTKAKIAMGDPHTFIERLSRFVSKDLIQNNPNAYIGERLRENLPENSLIAIAQCGVIPYATPGLRYLDTFGLMSREIAENSRASAGFGNAADPALVFDKKPDAISGSYTVTVFGSGDRVAVYDQWKDMPLYRNMLNGDFLREHYVPWKVFRVVYEIIPFGPRTIWEERVFRKRGKDLRMPNPYMKPDPDKIFDNVPVDMRIVRLLS